MRILLDLPSETVGSLEALAVRFGTPRAEVLRRAVDSYVSAHAEPIDAFFGLWANNPRTADVPGYLDAVRAEWVR